VVVTEEGATMTVKLWFSADPPACPAAGVIEIASDTVEPGTTVMGLSCTLTAPPAGTAVEARAVLETPPWSGVVVALTTTPVSSTLPWFLITTVTVMAVVGGKVTLWPLFPRGSGEGKSETEASASSWVAVSDGEETSAETSADMVLVVSNPASLMKTEGASRTCPGARARVRRSGGNASSAAMSMAPAWLICCVAWV
jgi:hypothetical protein